MNALVASRPRPIKRKIKTEQILTTYNAIEVLLSDTPIVNLKTVKYTDFEATDLEKEAFSLLVEDLFAYNVVKLSRDVEDSNFFPILKVFLARKEVTCLEQSAMS